MSETDSIVVSTATNVSIDRLFGVFGLVCSLAVSETIFAKEKDFEC